MNMKILIVTSQLKTGGAEMLTIQLANKFSVLSGVECKVMCLRPEATELSANLLPGLLLPLKNTGQFKKARKVRGLYHKEKPDAILCQSLSAYIFMRLTLFRFQRYKLFLAIHFTKKYGITEIIKLVIAYTLVKISRDEIILSYRKQHEGIIRRLGLSKARVHVIYNGTQIPVLYRKSIRTKAETFRILHIANHRKEKDQQTLFRTLAKLGGSVINWSATIRGSIPSDVKKTYIQYCERNGIANRVNFVNYVSDVAELYTKHNIFVLSSIAEALPMTAIEAFSYGLPCILTDVGGCSEVVDDGVNGYLVPIRSEKTMAERFRNLMENPMMEYAMGERARQKAEQVFDINQCVSNYLILFQKVWKR